jgi:hypothetical protein
MIEGLKLTFSGEELRKVLEERIDYHDRCADRWRREQTRTKEDETEDAPLLPDHMCEHEEEEHMWRSEVLGFIREHIEPQETYRVGAADAEFGELLPIKPGSVAQAEYEERTRGGFHLEQISKRLRELATGGLCAAMTRSYETPDGYKVRRVEVENGPEIIRIDRTDS